jgi:hypothetical protein
LRQSEYWRILNKKCGKIIKYISTEKYKQMHAASENQADSKILAANENQADGKILAAHENQADGKILAADENQADGKILAPGEIPASMEKLAELEKVAACLLFRLGGISNC